MYQLFLFIIIVYLMKDIHCYKPSGFEEFIKNSAAKDLLSKYETREIKTQSDLHKKLEEAGDGILDRSQNIIHNSACTAQPLEELTAEQIDRSQGRDVAQCSNDVKSLWREVIVDFTTLLISSLREESSARK